MGVSHRDFHITLLVQRILQLTGPELVELNRRLREAYGEDGSGAGVREPVPPRPPARSAAA
jgi:hypothetical protein